MKDCVAVETTEHSCEHCGRSFARENTLVKHLCEQKRRWLDRDRPSNRIGYLAWKNFYNRHHPNKKNTEYRDFLKSNYYGAFVKFGGYCVDVGVINPGAYANYLVKNQTPIDTWCSDRSYTAYLIEYLRTEDPLQGVERSVQHLLDMSQLENIQLGDVFLYANTNKICHLISGGKISPWVLYHSSGGPKFLSRLDQSQVNLIFDYIHPEKWNIKFKRDPESVATVKDILTKAKL